ncbi:hypothetical protein [Novosphingobium aerophilum]|uniref:Antifreeze protein n=1 Tax=Novosphingobium aerophilum TaxID=2839843 RepID=A0A7X1F7A9_9SPHN|nr:hypothetical protein [Novosphingobium aerophilum]MBC2651701.1 hypothetical protein [Novosphingobium aerophilum]
MKVALWLAGTALVLSSALAIAQDAPESLLPPGFDRPAPRPARAPAPASAPAATAPQAPRAATPVVQPLPGAAPATAAGPVALPTNLPSIEALAAMTPEELEAALNLKPSDDIPPAARRAMSRVGLLDEGEGGLPHWHLARQDPLLVRTALAANRGRLVSRWGHIVLRRALASRLDAPAGMDPAEFAALRAGLLVRMGEGEVARGLVQDVDTANFGPLLTAAALDAYVATGDFTGICPAVQLQGAGSRDKPWQVLGAICDAFAGEGSRGLASLDRLTYFGAMPRVDMLLAQKYAGAAGKGRRAVTIEWNQVKDMTPWRYAMTTAIGLQPPADLMKSAGPGYALMAATAPALGLEARAVAADRAAACGILSSTAMVDLYAQIYDEADATSESGQRAAKLRDAYVAATADDRAAAIRSLWGEGRDRELRYGRQVLTAYAAARLAPTKALADDAAPLIAAMLSAGLDRNAARWSGVVDSGSEAWALLALANPAATPVTAGAIDDFHAADDSADLRKSRFLVAGLAGLGRLPLATAQDLAGKYGFALDRPSRWAKAIDLAAEYRNATLVALLVGLGMQGDDWKRMTPRNLFHIVSALNRVGLGAEARMIAAEAVARA